MRTSGRAGILALWLAAAACAPTQEVLWTIGDWQLRADDGALRISHGERDGLLRLRSVHADFFEPEVSSLFGFFRFERTESASRQLDLHWRDGVLLLGGRAVTAAEGPAGDLHLQFPGAGAGLRLQFDCGREDRFWGFGEQYNFVDLRGREVPIWVQEQGVGRAENPSAPWIGRLTDSYFPMPWFLDPARGFGLLVTNTTYSEFDLCHENPTRWSVEVWDPGGVGLRLFPGPTPRAVVSQLTGQLGRPQRPPPDWALGGVWLAAQGGSESVRTRVETALKEEIPVSAVWVQDWVGLRNFGGENFGVRYRWRWDRELYPGLPTMIADFAAEGVRFLGYFNPFVLPEFEHWDTGAAEGWLVRDANEDPYRFQIITFEGGLLDVGHPDAGAWFQGYAEVALDLGMRGWMADFGEWLPWDARIHGGAAPRLHNLYPLQWHRLHREVLEDRFPDGDFVLLTRAGYTGSQSVAQIVWAGDQEADWSEEDGLPTVVTAGLTLGLAGIPFFTHDIAGFSGGPSDRELFQRWTELGAFSPVMRTHDGLRKFDNHRFDSDVTTLTHFRRMARIHAAMLPLWRTLAAEAVESGLPVLRHTVLVDPNWPQALTAHRQWMIGDDLVFAPVTAPGVDAVEICLPAGRWQALAGGAAVDGRHCRTVPAPIGEPAVWVREGAWPEVLAAIRAISG